MKRLRIVGACEVEDHRFADLGLGCREGVADREIVEPARHRRAGVPSASEWAWFKRTVAAAEAGRGRMARLHIGARALDRRVRSAMPLASPAAIAEASVQPVPWVWRVCDAARPRMKLSPPAVDHEIAHARRRQRGRL